MKAFNFLHSPTTFSYPGSFCIGFSCKSDCKTIKISLTFCVALHPGPLQVFIIDKHTLPSVYKFGLNLTYLFKVLNNTLGGFNG